MILKKSSGIISFNNIMIYKINFNIKNIYTIFTLVCV